MLLLRKMCLKVSEEWAYLAVCMAHRAIFTTPHSCCAKGRCEPLKSSELLSQCWDILFLKMCCIFNFLLLKASDLFLDSAVTVASCSSRPTEGFHFQPQRGEVRGFRKRLCVPGGDMTTRVLEASGEALLKLPPPPSKTVAKDINRKAAGFFHVL